MSDQPKLVQSTADSLARLHTAEAIGALVTVLRDNFAKPSEKIQAANSLLDRGHGKAAQAVIAVPARQALAQRMAALDDAALLAIAAAARQRNTAAKVVGTQPALPGPFGGRFDDITDAELVEADPPKEPDYDLPPAEAEEFPSQPKLPGNPWD